MGYMIGMFNDTNESFSTPGGVTYPLLIMAGTFLEAIVLNPANADAVSLGLTDGGTDYEDGRPLNANQNNTFIIQQKFDANTILYFTGLTGLTVGSIYKR